MFIKLTGENGAPLLLDVDRIVSAMEFANSNITKIVYADPNQSGGANVGYWRVKETVAEIMELIDENRGRTYEQLKKYYGA